MRDGIDDIAEGMRRRIAVLDEEIARVDPLREERTRLQRALDLLAADTAAGASPQTGPPSRRRQPTAGSSGAGRQRAARGENHEKIVRFLRGSGPATASEIAQGTGINRPVVYSTLRRLGEDGTVAESGGEGTARFGLADA